MVSDFISQWAGYGKSRIYNSGFGVIMDWFGLLLICVGLRIVNYSLNTGDYYFCGGAIVDIPIFLMCVCGEGSDIR